MTDSIFDPTGPQTEHSGSRYQGPDAANISHMPPDVTDGDVEQDVDQPADEDPQTEQIAQAEEQEQEQRDRDDPTKTRPDQ